VRLFPALAVGGYRKTSSADESYNCIAFAAGRTDAWWWPDCESVSFWPADVPREETIEAFVSMFEKLGYMPCENADFEQGFEKVALFAKDSTPTHAAVMGESGVWKSKLGGLDDIEHGLEGVCGELYGQPVMFLRRPQAVNQS
jgi:hypothetical protein